MGFRSFVAKRKFKPDKKKETTNKAVLVPKLRLPKHGSHLSPRVGDLLLPQSVRFTIRTRRGGIENFLTTIHENRSLSRIPGEDHTVAQLTNDQSSCIVESISRHEANNTVRGVSDQENRTKNKKSYIALSPCNDNSPKDHETLTSCEVLYSQHGAIFSENTSIETTPRSLFMTNSRAYDEINRELLSVFTERVTETSQAKSSQSLEVLTTDSSFTQSPSAGPNMKENCMSINGSPIINESPMINGMANATSCSSNNSHLIKSVSRTDNKEPSFCQFSTKQSSTRPPSRQNKSVSIEKNAETLLFGEGFRSLVNHLYDGVHTVVREFFLTEPNFSVKQKPFVSNMSQSNQYGKKIFPKEKNSKDFPPLSMNSTKSSNYKQPTHSKELYPNPYVNEKRNIEESRLRHSLNYEICSDPAKMLYVKLPEAVPSNKQSKPTKSDFHLQHMIRCNSTAELLLFSETFNTDFWKEEQIKPIKKKMSPPSAWQKFWNTVDPNTLGELKRRHRSLVMREGYPVITRQKWNPSLYGKSKFSGSQNRHTIVDLGKRLWRNAAYSHIELTIFSVENIPYVSQVIVEAGTLRYCMPFNCRFLRFPYLGDDQVIRLWFNSPVGKSQRNPFHPIVGVDEGVNHWTECAQSDNEVSTTLQNGAEPENSTHCLNNLDEDDVEELQMQRITDTKIHPQSQTFINAAPFEYTPANDFRTFFRFDIPISAIKQSENLYREEKALLDPKGAFYECNADDSPENNFRSLCESGKIIFREPAIKFRVQLNIQGAQTLITTGDIGKDHLLRLPPCERNTTSVFKKLVYVSKISDSLDIAIGELLNQNNQAVLKQVGPDKLYRLCSGKYSIDNNEYDVTESIISPTSYPDFDFTLYSEIKSSEYAKGFKIPLVCTEDFYQPLLDFLLDSKRNQRWISIEKQRGPYHQYGIADISKNLLPQLTDWSNIKIPPELQDDPVNVQKLHAHAQAIRANMAMKTRQLTQDSQISTQALLEDLEPPLLRLGKGPHSSLCRYTFTNPEDTFSCPSVVAVPDYLRNGKARFINLFLVPYCEEDVDLEHNMRDLNKKSMGCYDSRITQTETTSRRDDEKLIKMSNLKYSALSGYDERSRAPNKMDKAPQHWKREIIADRHSSQICFFSDTSTTGLSQHGSMGSVSPSLSSEKSLPHRNPCPPKVPRLFLNKDRLSQNNQVYPNVSNDTEILARRGLRSKKPTSVVNSIPICQRNNLRFPSFPTYPHCYAGQKKRESFHDSLFKNKIEYMEKEINMKKNASLKSVTSTNDSRYHALQSPDNLRTDASDSNTSKIRLRSHLHEKQENDNLYKKKNYPLPHTTMPCVDKEAQRFRNQISNVPSIEDVRKRLLEDQRINKLAFSRFTGKPLGYHASGISPLGEVILPDEPPLPDFSILKEMSLKERQQLKEFRTNLLCQKMLQHHQMEWYRSKVYQKLIPALKSYQLERS